jgi:hypothetical protein
MVTTGVLPLDDLGRLGGYSFQGAYSGIGVLNSVDHLWGFAHDLAELVTPGGFLIFFLVGCSSLWETLGLLLHARFRSVFSMRPSSTFTDARGEVLRAYGHTPREIVKGFERWFECVEIGGVNIFMPRISSRPRKGPRVPVAVLERLDDLLCRVRPFSRWGQYFYIVLRRV